MGATTGVQSIERAFAVLGAVSDRPAGLTAIAARVELPKSTVARLLSTLEGVGAVERLDGSLWRVGPGLGSLAGAVSAEGRLLAAARPQLTALVSSLGEDAGLALPDGYDVHYVEQVESDNPVQVRDWTGTRVPMHAVPSGLALLAEWPEDAVAAYVERGLERMTPRTIGDARALRARLAEVREGGVAWGLEEFAEGIVSVAAPVRDANGNAIAAVHVHGPAYRFPPPDGADEVAERVRGAAAAISARLA